MSGGVFVDFIPIEGAERGLCGGRLFWNNFDLVPLHTRLPTLSLSGQVQAITLSLSVERGLWGGRRQKGHQPGSGLHQAHHGLHSSMAIGNQERTNLFYLPNRLFFMLASVKKSLFLTPKLLFFTLQRPA
jgi:hypothetical protein